MEMKERMAKDKAERLRAQKEKEEKQKQKQAKKDKAGKKKSKGGKKKQRRNDFDYDDHRYHDRDFTAHYMDRQLDHSELDWPTPDHHSWMEPGHHHVEHSYEHEHQYQWPDTPSHETWLTESDHDHGHEEVPVHTYIDWPYSQEVIHEVDVYDEPLHDFDHNYHHDIVSHHDGHHADFDEYGYNVDHLEAPVGHQLKPKDSKAKKPAPTTDDK